MKSLNTFTKAILMIGLSLTMMACDKKKDSQPNFARNNRGNVGNNRNFVPGGDARYGQNGGTFGYVYNNQSDMRSVLYDFLALGAAQDEIGFTSGQLYQNTGIVMTGEISPDGRSGNVRLLIWDDIAVQYGEAYQVSLDVIDGQVNAQGASILLRDGTGTVELNGNWNTQQGTWEGTVTYDNGQGSRTLGSFITPECSPIRCQ